MKIERFGPLKFPEKKGPTDLAKAMEAARTPMKSVEAQMAEILRERCGLGAERFAESILSIERNGIPLRRVVELWEQGKIPGPGPIGYHDVDEYYRDDDYQHTQACKNGDHVECSGWTGEGPKCRCDCHPMASSESQR